jgi:hypothetical protein
MGSQVRVHTKRQCGFDGNHPHFNFGRLHLMTHSCHLAYRSSAMHKMRAGGFLVLGLRGDQRIHKSDPWFSQADFADQAALIAMRFAYSEAVFHLASL